VNLRRLELVNFRIFGPGAFTPESEGTTVITGPNGTGKTSVLEAFMYLGTGAPSVARRARPWCAPKRSGPSSGPNCTSDTSPTLVEAEINPTGRSHTR
jgi:recombinational DNA repair ATPase RecF